MLLQPQPRNWRACLNLHRYGHWEFRLRLDHTEPPREAYFGCAV